MKFDRIRQFISVPRMDRYLVAAGRKPRAVRLYKGNLKVSQAFLPLLAVLEVVLRNRINASMATHFGDPDWIINQKTGFMVDPTLRRWNPARGVHEPNQYIKKEVEKAERRIRAAGGTITSGKIISEQTLGFWTEFYEAHYARLTGGKAMQAFSNPPVGHNRTQVVNALNKIRIFRNRVYHNEPICFNGNAIDFQLATDVHQLIMDVLVWIDPDLATWVSDIDAVPAKIKSATNI